MSRSFRDLLAIRAALFTTVAMGLGAGGMFLVLRGSLDRELNANILNVATIQAAALTDAETGEMHFHEWDLTPAEAASIQELVRYAQVWDASGESLLRSQYMTGDLPLGGESRMRASRGELLWEEGTFGGAPIRSLLYPLVRMGEVHAGHVLQVAAPLEARNGMLLRAGAFGVALVLLAGMGSFLGGRWLAVRMVLPVSEIIDEAEAVDPARPPHGIRVHGETREYERLVTVLNRMLERIRVAFDAQRRFTADASHELRSPLTAMRGEIELALRRNRSSEEYRSVLGSVREEVIRLGRVVEGLLTLARADAGAMAPHRRVADLGATLVEAIERLRTASPRELRVTLDLPAPIQVLHDPDLLAQLVVNLVDNAVRHGGGKGEVRVSAVREADDVCLAVEDSGAGLPDGVEETAFDRFWRADPVRAGPEAGGGLGLGLAIARAIAEAHGGSLRAVRSEALGGARFELRLPLG